MPSEATPPKLIPSFVNGFNLVANHIYLIVLPVFLDLFLWFGPHLRIKSILLPMVTEAINTVRETGTPQAQDMLVGMEDLWKLFLDRYNLTSSLSTFPLGVPAMMAEQPPLSNPLGGAPIVEMTSPFVIPLTWLLFSVIGLALGSFYLSLLANCFRKNPGQSLSSSSYPRLLAWQTIQMVILILVLVILMVVILLPTLVISSLLALLSPVLSWLVLLGMSFVAVWVMIPLIFTPHGIFALRQTALNAALSSARTVRYVLPGTGLFLLASIILYQGLGILWRTPPETSWMMLIGILGHAFISTGVMASSFVFYLSSFDWVQAARRATVIPGV